MEQHGHEEAERDTNVPRDGALADAPAGKLHASCELNERIYLLSRLNEPSPRPFSFNIGRLKGVEEILGSMEWNRGMTHDSLLARPFLHSACILPTFESTMKESRMQASIVFIEKWINLRCTKVFRRSFFGKDFWTIV